MSAPHPGGCPGARQREDCGLCPGCWCTAGETLAARGPSYIPEGTSPWESQGGHIGEECEHSDGSAGALVSGPAPLVTAALEGMPPVQQAPRPSLNTPTWQVKEARAQLPACPVLLGTAACGQVRALCRLHLGVGERQRQWVGFQESMCLPATLPPDLSSFKDHPCPPGHSCPCVHAPFLCLPGTFWTNQEQQQQKTVSTAPRLRAAGPRKFICHTWQSGF